MKMLEKHGQNTYDPRMFNICFLVQKLNKRLKKRLELNSIT